MLSVVTAVIWIVFAAAGIGGLRLGYPAFFSPPKLFSPVRVERLDVRVVQSPSVANVSRAMAPVVPVPEPQAAPRLVLPALAPVADPKLAVPFAIAVKGASRIVDARRAVPRQLQPVHSARAAAPVERLTFGEGEGDQPAPDYPEEARLAHQEGNVIVQMTVSENGDVTDAKVTSPCPWPMLNQAALRVVRDSWHFKKGPVRYRDIEFDFKLNQR